MKKVWYEKYIKDLTNRTKVNIKALKISEKGVDMENKKYLGLHVDEMRTYGDDVIIKIETLGVEPMSGVISLVRIDENGLNMVTADDSQFENKLRNMLADLDSKRVFLYHKDFTLQHLQRYVVNVPIHVIDLREVPSRQNSPNGFGGQKRMIDVPWDPIMPNEVPNLWINGDTDVVKIHALAEALRLFYMYADHVIREVTRIPLNTSMRRHMVRHPRSIGKVKLGAP